MLTTNAQDISVTEFYLDEKDLTANGRHAVEDQNGDKCALIRVQTTQKGFSFDGVFKNSILLFIYGNITFGYNFFNFF